MTSFENEHELTMRIQESKRIREKYPDRIPVIVEKSENSPESLPDIDKRKFLVPQDLTMGQLVFVIRKRIKLDPNTAIFLCSICTIRINQQNVCKYTYSVRCQDN